MPLALRMPARSGDVLERAVALVAIERVLATRKARRPAGHRHAFVSAQPRVGCGRGGEIEVDVVGDEQVETAVAVVVDERRARSPSEPRVLQAGALGQLGKRSVAVVAIQAVLAVVGDEQVLVAVIVVVARGGALAPAVRADARPGRHVLERAVAFVAIQVRRWLATLREPFERGAVDEEDVQSAVVVVVEDRDAAPGGLEQVPVGAKAAEYGHGRDTCVSGGVREREPDSGRVVGETCRRSPREQQCDDRERPHAHPDSVDWLHRLNSGISR